MKAPLSKDQEIVRCVDAALAGLDDYIGQDWGDILCWGKTLACEVRRLRTGLDGANKTIAHFMGPHGEGYISKFAAAIRVVEAWDEGRVHLSKGGKSGNEKTFSARDVEALIAIALAGERHAAEVKP